MRFELTADQARILSELQQAREKLDEHMKIACAMIGVDAAKITGGDTACEAPYLVLGDNEEGT